MSLPIALQVYSVREDASADLRGTLEKIKDMGYDGVEFAGLYGYAPQEVKDMCDSIGLIPVSAHVKMAEILERPEVFSDYKCIGCEYLALPSLPYTVDELCSGDIATAVTYAKQAGKLAKEQGIQLLYHNHDLEFTATDGEYILDILYRETTPDELQTEIDVCWVKIGGEDPCDYIRKYKGRAPIVHLKDFVGGKSGETYELIGTNTKKPKRPADFELRPIGYGVQSIKDIVAAAEDAGAKWLVVEQDRPAMGLTPLECAQKSREYLKSIGY